MADNIFEMKKTKPSKFQPLEQNWHNDFQDDLKTCAEDLKIIGTQRQVERGTRASKRSMLYARFVVKQNLSRQLCIDQPANIVVTTVVPIRVAIKEIKCNNGRR
jgi:hypothetical protein